MLPTAKELKEYKEILPDVLYKLNWRIAKPGFFEKLSYGSQKITKINYMDRFVFKRAVSKH